MPICPLDFFKVLKTNLQRKQIVTILLVLFLFLFMVFTLVLARYLSERTEQEDASAQTGAGNTITVCATGIVGQNGCDYIGGDNIQKAIDIAQNGTVVFIKSGNYVNVSVTVGMDKNITIEGDNSTFLKGIGYNEGINTMGTISLIDN